MKLTLHIFRKDARHLYPEILITVSLIIAFACAAPAEWVAGPTAFKFGTSIGLLGGLLRILIPISWLVLITRLVHEESLVGDCQFWITRPYSWIELLSAKLLFLAAFLYFPFFIMQCYLLHHAGFNPATVLPDLLRYLCYLTVVFVLPLIAIASVTSTFAKQTLSILGGLLYSVGLFALVTHLLNNQMFPPYLGGICASLFFVALAVIVILQYKTRRTRLARVLLITIPATLFAIVLIAPAKWMISRAYPTSSQLSGYHLVFDPDPLREQPGSGKPLIFNGMISLGIPVQLRGFPSGVRFKGKGAAVTITTQSGFQWHSAFHRTSADYSANDEQYNIELQIPASIFERVQDTPVQLAISIAADEYQPQSSQTIIVPTVGAFRTPERGICPLNADGFMPKCLFPLRTPISLDVSGEVFDRPCLTARPTAGNIATNFLGGDENMLTHDFDPVVTNILRLRPTGQARKTYRDDFLCPGTHLTITPQRIVGRGQLHFDQDGIVLARYVTHARDLQGQPD